MGKLVLTIAVKFNPYIRSPIVLFFLIDLRVFKTTRFSSKNLCYNNIKKLIFLVCDENRKH